MALIMNGTLHVTIMQAVVLICTKQTSLIKLQSKWLMLDCFICELWWWSVEVF